MANDNKLAPFNDEYFNGLSMEDIAQLAKKSIRLTKQHCDDNHKIEELEYKLDKAKECLEFLCSEDFIRKEIGGYELAGMHAGRCLRELKIEVQDG